MKVNLTRPLQLLQWSSYLSILVLVKLFIVLPLAVLLFNDFYHRLLPADSSQWVPLSTLNQVQSSESSFSYQQSISRVHIERDLPRTLDNGRPQPIPLRAHILYKVDLDTKFYCLPTSKGLINNIEEVELEVYLSPYSLVYRRTIPIICMKGDDSISIMELYRHGPSRLELYQKEWLNHIKLHDKIALNSNVGFMRYVLKMPESHRLIILPESGMRFRMNFEQGLRNVMLRWHKFTYAIGIIVFDFALSVLFTIAAFISFFLISRRKIAADPKTD